MRVEQREVQRKPQSPKSSRKNIEIKRKTAKTLVLYGFREKIKNQSTLLYSYSSLKRSQKSTFINKCFFVRVELHIKNMRKEN